MLRQPQVLGCQIRANDLTQGLGIGQHPGFGHLYGDQRDQQPAGTASSRRCTDSWQDSLIQGAFWCGMVGIGMDDQGMESQRAVGCFYNSVPPSFYLAINIPVDRDGFQNVYDLPASL